MGGMVLETNMSEILSRIEDQNKMEKQEVCTFVIRLKISVLCNFFMFFFVVMVLLIIVVASNIVLHKTIIFTNNMLVF